MPAADFLDPLHHEAATGRPSINLDGWMLNKEQNLASFHRHAADADICIVEGVMGLFDGRDGMTEAGSTAELAKWLGAPVLLVMDCWSMARSAAAMVKGYQEFDPDLNLAGVIFNKVGSPAHSQWLSEAVQSTGVTTQVFGGVPKDDSIAIKERYLGLHMPHEVQALQAHLAKLADLVEAHLDMEQVFETAATAQVPPAPRQVKAAAYVKNGRQHVRIGVAKDGAFSFYYNDNLRLLEEAGADLVFFSPIEDCLPANLGGLYLGGGYPEKYALELSGNKMLLAAVKAFAEAGGVVYAECGGLIYLSQSIQPLQEQPVSLAGLFPFRTQMTKDKMKMGYIEVETQKACNLFPPNCKARGHVYHFSEILQEKVVGGFTHGPGTELEWQTGYQATMQVPGAEAVPEGYTWKNVLASYVHLHFGSAPQLASSLVARCHAVDLQAVNAAASRACHQAELAAAHAEQHAFQVNGHVPGHMAPHVNGMHNGAFNPQAHMPKMMSTPDFAMPFQSSLRRVAAQMGRHSADDAQETYSASHTHLQQQLQHQLLQHTYQQQQQQTPRKVRYDADGHVDVHAQAYNPADYPGFSPPERTSSLPIFHKPLKPYCIPTSPLHEVAEHSSMDEQPASYRSQWAPHQSNMQHQHPPVGYHQQLQPPQQRSPFHSPPQGHGSQSPTYPPPLESAHSGVLPMNSVLQSNGAFLPAETAMMPSHSGMLSANSGMLSVNSGMLPDGAVYRPNSMGSAHPGMLSAQSSMLPNGASKSFERASSMLHAEAMSGYRHDDTCTASSSGRLAHASHGQAWSRSSSTGLQPASPDTAVSSNSIVSLLPSGTEILYALGLGDRVIGVSDLCDYPAEAAAKPKVSHSCFNSADMTSAEVEAKMQELKAKQQSPFTLDKAWLAQQRPALLLTQDACRACDVDSSLVAQALQEASPQTDAMVLSPRTMADAFQDIIRVGCAADVEDEALQLVDHLQSRLRKIVGQVAASPSRPKVLSLEGLQPLVLGGQWLPDMKELAGGRDAWQQPGDAPERISWEAIRRYAPEVLLLCPCSSNLERSLSEVCVLAGQAGWWALPAVKAGQVYICQHSLFSRPGPRLVDGVEVLARILHPDQISKTIPVATVMKLSLHGGQRCRPHMLHQYFKPYQ
ncbi:hypothetical protein ABBQ38_005288 [Trebouxia sp. C0009 RCD-2024]